MRREPFHARGGGVGGAVRRCDFKVSRSSRSMRLLRGNHVTLPIWLGVSGCDQYRAKSSLPDTVGHAVDVHATPWSADSRPMRGLSECPNHHARNAGKRSLKDQPWLLSSKMRMWRERTIKSSVYIVTEGRCFRIDGLPLPQRPFKGSAVGFNGYLIFDRWSQPHYGVHYVVDIKERRVVHAAPFPDQFYLDQQRDTQSLRRGRQITMDQPVWRGGRKIEGSDAPRRRRGKLPVRCVKALHARGGGVGGAVRRRQRDVGPEPVPC